MQARHLITTNTIGCPLNVHPRIGFASCACPDITQNNVDSMSAAQIIPRKTLSFSPARLIMKRPEKFGFQRPRRSVVI